MELLTAELQAQLPPLYAQEENPDPSVYARFFLPESYWTWLVTEGANVGDEFPYFGYVSGLAREWDYLVLSEMKSARGPNGLPIDRNLYFKAAQ